MEAEITAGGDVMVEGQHVGQLNGFRFTADPLAAGEEARTLNAAAQKALASEIEGRAGRVHAAVDEAFVLSNDGLIRWLGEPIGRITAGAHILEPQVRVISDEQLTGLALEQVQRRLELWLASHVAKLLGPCKELETGEGLDGIARGIAFQVGEALGVLERSKVADELKALPQEARASLRKLGVRFGAYHLYLPALVKPAPRALAAQLWALKNSGEAGELKGVDDVPHLAASGRTSFVADGSVPRGFYRAAGFRVCGERAVRVDILERLADLIRPAIAYRPGTTAGDPPPGTADGDGFTVTVGMTSLAGCSAEAFGSVLKSLGYVLDRRPGPAITVPLVPKAPVEPVRPPAAKEADGAEAASADPEAAGEPAAEATGGAQAAEPAAEVIADDLASRVSLARQSELIAAALEGGALDAIEPLPAPAPLPAAAAGAVARAETVAAEGVDAPERDEAEASDDGAGAVSDAVLEASPDPRFEGGPATEPPGDAPDVGFGTPAPHSIEPMPAQEATPNEATTVEAEQAEAIHAEGAQGEPGQDGAVRDEASQGEAMTADPASAAAPPGAPAEAAAVEPAEVPLIEVWRPHRHNVHNRRPAENRRGGPRRPHGDRQGAPHGDRQSAPRRDPAAAQAGEAQLAGGQPGEGAAAPGSGEAGERPNRFRDGRRPGGEHGGERRHGDRPHGHQGPRPDGNRGHGHRADGHRGDGQRADGHRPQGDRPFGDRPRGRPPGQGNERGAFGDRPHGERSHGERGGRRDERRGSGFQTTEAPRPRERQPDPNSPFAKLAALKAQMEKEKG